MVRQMVNVGLLALILAAGLPAWAAPVTKAETVGGIDSFGNVTENGSQDADPVFDAGFLWDATEAGDTDMLLSGWSRTITMNILPGTVTAAKLVLRTGGFGYYGAATVSVNGVELTKRLSDGQNENAPVDYAEQSVHVDIFDGLLADGVKFLSNDVLIKIIVPQGSPAELDLGAVDYATLELTIDPAGGDLPEPVSLALALLGLAAAGAARRRAAR